MNRTRPARAALQPALRDPRQHRLDAGVAQVVVQDVGLCDGNGPGQRAAQVLAAQVARRFRQPLAARFDIHGIFEGVLTYDLATGRPATAMSLSS